MADSNNIAVEQSARDRALTDEQVLTCILTHVDKKDLYTARTLSRGWKDVATRVLFSHGSKQELDMLLKLKEKTGTDYGHVVESVFIFPTYDLIGYLSLNLSEVTHVDACIEQQWLGLIRAKCPNINRITVCGVPAELVLYLPAWKAEFSNVIFNVQIVPFGSFDGPTLTALSTLLQQTNVNDLDFSFELREQGKGESVKTFFDTLVRAPSLSSRLSKLSLKSYPQIFRYLAQYQDLGKIFGNIKYLRLDVIGWRRADANCDLAKDFLQFVKCAAELNTLHMTVEVPKLEAIWFEKLTDNAPKLRSFTFVVYSGEPLPGTLFGYLRKWRYIQEMSIANYDCTSSDVVPLDLENGQFDQDPTVVWFPFLNKLEFYSTIDKTEFRRLILHHMTELSSLKINSPVNQPVAI